MSFQYGMFSPSLMVRSHHMGIYNLTAVLCSVFFKCLAQAVYIYK